ncbi:hypothetical protein IAU60_006820 [Kwoniella sp. DSM 27419]
MPRAGKTKTRLHTSAVSLPVKLQPEVEQPLPIPEPLSFALDEPSTSRAQKRADFIQAVQSAPHPYLLKSKSHARREKRKARSELSTNLTSLNTALETVLPEAVRPLEEPVKKKRNKAEEAQRRELEEVERKRAAQREREKGMIGEGKGRTLGEKKRRGAIQDAAKRIPAVMAHPAYKTNPWAAIREHVGNTVAPKSN